MLTLYTFDGEYNIKPLVYNNTDTIKLTMAQLNTVLNGGVVTIDTLGSRVATSEGILKDYIINLLNSQLESYKDSLKEYTLKIEELQATIARVQAK